MTDLAFNQSVALSLYQSEDEFPIDLDAAWQWLGYSRKDKCLEAMQSNLEEGIDFSTSRGKSTGGRPKQEINLSIEGFKVLGMMAGTEQGKTIRKYFLECERIAKVRVATVQMQLPPITSAKLVKLTNEIATITNRISELKQLLSQEERKLQDTKQAQIKEAEIYKAANPEVMKGALLCDEILKTAKQENPFRRN